MYPRIKVSFGGNDAFREPMVIDIEEFVGVKGFKAKGKRIANWTLDKVEELEPTRFPEPKETEDDNENKDQDQEDNLDPDKEKSEQQVIDEMTGQLNLFSDQDE